MYPKNEKVPAPLKFPIIGTPAGNLSHRYFTLSSRDASLPEEDKLIRMLWLRSPFYIAHLSFHPLQPDPSVLEFVENKLERGLKIITTISPVDFRFKIIPGAVL